MALAAGEWFDLPARMVALAIGLWVLVDVVMYPFVKSAYGPHGRGGVADLVGAHGTAREALDPEGYVRIASELWRAELAPECRPVAAGERVRVRGVHGLTLVVEPADGAEPDPGAAGSA